MKLEENKVYKTKNGKYIHIKEITRYYDDDRSICAIVTGTRCNFKTDSKTSVLRKVYTEKEFLELIAENQEEFINCPMEFQSVSLHSYDFGLKFDGDRCIFLDRYEKLSVGEFDNDQKVKTKIRTTPTHFSELEVGRWYFATDEPTFEDKNTRIRYKLYAGNEYYFINNGVDVIKSNICWNYWYEVVIDEE